MRSSILTKFGVLRKVFVKVPNIKFRENQSDWRGGRASRNDEVTRRISYLYERFLSHGLPYGILYDSHYHVSEYT